MANSNLKYARILYQGIQRQPSDHDATIGSLEEAINVIPENGEMRPYLSPPPFAQLDGKLLFVHKNLNYENLIYRNGNALQAAALTNETNVTPIGDVMPIYGDVLNIQAVGNTLVVITPSEIKYALYAKGSYTNLGSDIPFPNITFSLSYPQSESITDNFGEQFLEDFVALRAVEGYGINETLPWYMRQQAVTDHFNKVATDRLATSNSVVSVDFANKVKGRINATLAKYRKNNQFVFPFFVRYALRMYDGSLIKHSMPFLLLPTKFTPFDAGVAKTPTDANKYTVYYDFTSATLQCTHTAISQFSNLSDIIKSVDIFISAPIYTYAQDGGINGLTTNPNSATNASALFGGIYYTPEDTRTKISETGQFYKVASIPIADLTTYRSTSELKIDNIENVQQYELMSDDYLSHDTITAKHAFTYNQRLHLSGITRQPFGGFGISAYCDYDISNQSAQYQVGAQPFVFYPNPKCRFVRLGRTVTNPDGSTSTRSSNIPLSEHKYLNGAFFLEPNLDSITYRNADSSSSGITFISSSNSEDESNKLYVSKIQNPFLFPAEGRVTLPVGNIISMASNTVAISQGQFGQFPLYVFTDDGIWMLEVSSQGAYTARQPISREVCINPNILQLDKQLAFISKKGLIVIHGATTECISDIISENNNRVGKVPVAPILNKTDQQHLADIYNTIPVEIFMKSCNLAYEYINGKGRIFMLSPTQNYAYVFDIKAKAWAKVISPYGYAVPNYPDCYVQDSALNIANLATLVDGNSYTQPMPDGSTPPDNKTDMFMVTRAISFNDVLFIINQLAHRGLCKSPINTVIYASRNGIDYTTLASSSKPIIHLRGSGYRYFKLSLSARLEPQEVIAATDIAYTLKQNNRLR